MNKGTIMGAPLRTKYLFRDWRAGLVCLFIIIGFLVVFLILQLSSLHPNVAIIVIIIGLIALLSYAVFFILSIEVSESQKNHW